ncbi:hypothetical protein KBA41_00655 [Candidatus Ozemobacteraceae bacterium]|nr:hypothetical protein [Candidatus Ozemobacteraceae bacterium]
MATSNNRRKRLEAIQTKIERAFSSQELPIFRLIVAEGSGLFLEMSDFERLAEAFPAILAQTYEGSEATPLGHERSYNETKIFDALRTSPHIRDFIGRFTPQAAAAPVKAKKSFFRRIIASEQPGGTSHLSMEKDRYEARLSYRGKQHLLKIMEHLGIRLEMVPREKQTVLKDTCFEIEGIPDLQQPGEVTLLDLPVRIVVHGKPGQSGFITFMIFDSRIPGDRTFSLPDRIRELDTLLATA